MGRETVAREIARLDALSRTRPLDEGESRQLQKMISMERRYTSFAAANGRVRKARASSAQNGAGTASPGSSFGSSSVTLDRNP